MTPDFLKYVRHLSKQDRKSLSQKALKTCEEVGELAKVVLPVDNAYATTHRFVERESILEEAVDTVLCALSVAYHLDFTDDEVTDMFAAKAEKWALLQSKEQDVKYPLPYEIHLTVMLEGEQTVEGFRAACAEIGVKPIVLDLQDRNGETTMVDVMTSSKHFGDNFSAYYAAFNLKHALHDRRYAVVRTKIETVPWHPAAPVGDQPMPPNCYFESHIPITLMPEEMDALRASVAQDFGDLHISRNAFKREENGNVVIMATVRRNDVNYSEFKDRLGVIVHSLSRGWTLGKVITEFSIYDTKVSHDASWIKG
jgi:NTP pyrophosphatase (non-canonical NTP hydrolase)